MARSPVDRNTRASGSVPEPGAPKVRETSEREALSLHGDPHVNNDEILQKLVPLGLSIVSLLSISNDRRIRHSSEDFSLKMSRPFSSGTGLSPERAGKKITVSTEGGHCTR